MAKQKPLEVLRKTGPEQPGDLSDLEAGHVRPIGIGLREGEIRALDEIAGSYSLSRGGLIRLILRLFIRDHRAGDTNLSEYVTEPLPPKRKPDFDKIK